MFVAVLLFNREKKIVLVKNNVVVVVVVYPSKKESSCDSGVRERDIDLERTYRYHAVTLAILTVVFVTTTLVTIREQKGILYYIDCVFFNVRPSFLVSFTFSLTYSQHSDTFLKIFWSN